MNPTPSTSNAVLESKLAGLSNNLDQFLTRFEARMEEISSRLNQLDVRMQSLENCQTKGETLLSARLDAAWRKLDEHDRIAADSVSDRKCLTAKVLELESRMKLVYWLMGLIGGAVVLAIVGAVMTLVLR